MSMICNPSMLLSGRTTNYDIKILCNIFLTRLLALKLESILFNGVSCFGASHIIRPAIEFCIRIDFIDLNKQINQNKRGCQQQPKQKQNQDRATERVSKKQHLI